MSYCPPSPHFPSQYAAGGVSATDTDGPATSSPSSFLSSFLSLPYPTKTGTCVSNAQAVLSAINTSDKLIDTGFPKKVTILFNKNGNIQTAILQFVSFLMYTEK